MIKEEKLFNLARYLDKNYHTNFCESSCSNWCELRAKIFQREVFKHLLKE